MNVKLIRMSSGEDLITNLVSETEDTIVVENAIVGVPTGQGTLGFAPWSPMISKAQTEITVDKKFVVYIAEADESIVDQYTQMYSNIITPDKKIIV
jgi:hypothetical protein